MASEKVKRPQTRGEEIANTVSHGLGAVLAAAGAVPLAVRGILSGSAKAGVSLTAYGISLVLLYTASAGDHGGQNPGPYKPLALPRRLPVARLLG